MVVNDKGQPVYELKAEGTGITCTLSRDKLDSLQAELDRTGVTMETVQERYRIQQPEAMSEELYKKVMSALKRTGSAKAA